MRLDLDAPIIPGRSAAGIDLAAPIGEVLASMGRLLTPQRIANPYDGVAMTRYRSDCVHLWEKEGVVRQIGVYSGYRGKLMHRIALGASIADIETQLGECEETEEDNLAIKGIAGLVFDSKGEFPPAPNGVDFSQPAVRNARVTAFYVFRG